MCAYVNVLQIKKKLFKFCGHPSPMEEIILQLRLISLAEQDGNAKIAFLQCLFCPLSTHAALAIWKSTYSWQD